MKLNKAGWLAAGIVGVLVLSGSLWVGQSVWTRIRGLEGLQPVAEYTPEAGLPVATSQPTGTATPAAEPLPDGWALQPDPFTGDRYLAPSPEIEAAVREAFEAVLALEIVEDRPNEEALAFARDAAVDRVTRSAVPRFAEYYRARDTILLGTLGPQNPARCQDHHVCQVMRAALAVTGAIIYDEGICNNLSTGIPIADQIAGNFTLADTGDRCVTRYVENGNSYVIYIATVERQEDERWIVSDWRSESVARQ